ncbi:MAG: carboxypeptidase-like regulatory domain-containing protein [Tannerellaceae bacterium]|nr:carboxypeptidase-like regulatory domain-containing protein [Tannerellaceae bacterium]
MVKGTTTGSITSIDGDFILSNVPQPAVLVVSYIGYITKEVPVEINNRCGSSWRKTRRRWMK